ncbi:4Fe-4S binding protein [Shewanella sedimentimangrovi]|uniref:4Fe-4S binding protein n=1 Tax=Shewanella sedimentimangrovi TaxID=2814293 RepID=A0ABX7R4J3_9GAMM|nr:4Fe-4S binding protein [Shewanella sedimentimangrovi]QSX37730.1 4Fe-4S binding protein [Shewanella sedimentimangrovi]
MHVSEDNVIPCRNVDVVPQQQGRMLWLERFFFKYRSYIGLVHFAVFWVFLALLFVPLFLDEVSETDTVFTHFTLLANYTMWGLWFPLVFLSVIFTGRSWCGLLCPMGAASEYINKFGLHLKIPAFIRWEGMPIISFLIITTLGQTVGVRDHPEAIAYVFGSVMLAAIIIGYLYGRNNRVWCRHMCPIGLMLGLFSRLGVVQFFPKRPSHGADQYHETSLCPTMIDLRHKKESRHCIECFKCVHPEAKSSLIVRARAPGEEVENIHSHNPNWAEVWFFFLGTGSALGGFLWLVLPLYQDLRQALGEWFIEHDQFWIGESGPWWLMSVHPERREVYNWLDFMTIVGFMTAVMLVFATTMFLLNLLSSSIAHAGTGKDRSQFWASYVELAYQYMPVAMVSLLIGLGGKIFELLGLVGLGSNGILTIKLVLFGISLLWSLWLGWRIQTVQEVPLGRKVPGQIVGTLTSLFIAACWWPAIFGI